MKRAFGRPRPLFAEEHGLLGPGHPGGEEEQGHHEQEAQAHDFHLLIKPVVPNKLRAMIAFKLGVRTGP